MIHNSNQGGFTLLEFFIYITVITLVLLSVLGILNITVNVRARQEAKSEVLRNASFVMERMSRLGREADAFGAVVSTSVEFIEGGATTTISADLVSGKLQINSGAGFQDLLSSQVLAEETTSSAPIFQRIGNNTVYIQLKLRYNDQGGRLYKYSTNVETTITLR